MAFDMSKIGVKRNIPKVNFTDYTGIIVGYPKYGKTTLASMFPKSIIVPFEEGFKAQVVNYVEGISTWKDFIGFVDTLEANRAEIGDEIQTIVFDTVNEAYAKCLPYMLQVEGKKAGAKYTAIGDLPYGLGYAKLDEYFKKEIDRIQALGFTILFISHSKVKTIKPKNGEAYDTYTSTMGDRLEKIVYPLVDYIIFGEKKKVTDPTTGLTSIKRVMIVSGADNEENNAGSRLALNEDIVFDNEEQAFNLFQDHFEKTIQEKLNKAGIKEDIKKISERQKQEKMDNVNKYIENNKKIPNDDLVKEIQSLISKATPAQNQEFVGIMSANNVTTLKNPDDIPNEVLVQLLNVLK